MQPSASRHRAEIEASEICGCFSCLATFPPTEIRYWTDYPEATPVGREDELGVTALCPRCGIDSVIGSASGYPITREFLGSALGEDDFWRRLEVRVCRELAGMPDPALRWLGCDGFEPWQYISGGDKPRIEGRAWFLEGRGQTEWQFTLFLPRPFGSRDEIPWASLLPAENVTRWLALDRPGKRIQIEPSAAVPDPA